MPSVPLLIAPGNLMEVSRGTMALLNATPVVVVHHINVGAIGNQQTGVTFTVSGTLINYATPPTLTYSVNGGAAVPIPAIDVTTTVFFFSLSLSTSASNTITVTDGTASGTSNTFSVAAAALGLSLNAPSPVTAGSVLGLTGTTYNYVTQPGSFDVSFDGGNSFTVLNLINSPSGSTFAITVPAGNVPGAGTYSVVVRDSANPTVSSSAVSLTVNPPSGSTTPADVAGIEAWWDASTTAGITIGGSTGGAWMSTITNVADQIGTRPLVPTATAVAYPHLVGGYGGVGNTYDGKWGTYDGRVWPVMSPDVALKPSTISTFGPNGEITIYMVWSRPNIAQNSAYNPGTGSGVLPCYTFTNVNLLTAASTVILAMSSNGNGSDQLILFPATINQVVTSTIEKRHTHSIIVRISGTTGCDVWLDGTKLTTSSLTSPFGTTATPRQLTFLGTGAAGGSAQCWFHEGATWPQALVSSDITTLLTAATKWPRGPRAGRILIAMGQSNAIDMGANDGSPNYENISQSVMYLTSLLSFTIMKGRGGANIPTSMITMNGGCPIADTSGLRYLTDNGSGNPSTFGLGTLGTSTQAFVNAIAAIDKPDLAGAWMYYAENDTGYTYAQKTYFTGVAKQWISTFRGFFTGTAATAPIFWISALPFGHEPGEHVHRETVYDLSQDPTQGVYNALTMTGDSNFLNPTSYSTVTGYFIGGDNQHRDYTDDRLFSNRLAHVMANTLVTLGLCDPGAAMPTNYQINGGPKAVAAHYEGTTHAATGTVLVTIQHDAGNDLNLPLLAATGIGWVVVDGITSMASYTVSTPVIQCTAAVRVDSTHIRLTLASTPTHSASSCMLHYVFGQQNASSGSTNANNSACLGRGSAVTDNYASVGRPAGSDIAVDVGPVFAPNFPIQATTYGIVMT